MDPVVRLNPGSPPARFAALESLFKERAFLTTEGIAVAASNDAWVAVSGAGSPARERLLRYSPSGAVGELVLGTPPTASATVLAGASADVQAGALARGVPTSLRVRVRCTAACSVRVAARDGFGARGTRIYAQRTVRLLHAGTRFVTLHATRRAPRTVREQGLQAGGPPAGPLRLPAPDRHRAPSGQHPGATVAVEVTTPAAPLHDRRMRTSLLCASASAIAIAMLISGCGDGGDENRHRVGRATGPDGIVATRHHDAGGDHARSARGDHAGSASRGAGRRADAHGSRSRSRAARATRSPCSASPPPRCRALRRPGGGEGHPEGRPQPVQQLDLAAGHKLIGFDVRITNVGDKLFDDPQPNGTLILFGGENGKPTNLITAGGTNPSNPSLKLKKGQSATPAWRSTSEERQSSRPSSTPPTRASATRGCGA